MQTIERNQNLPPIFRDIVNRMTPHVEPIDQDCEEYDEAYTGASHPQPGILNVPRESEKE